SIDGQQVIDALAGFFDVALECRIDPLREPILQPPPFSIFLVPLRLVSRNLWLIWRDFPKQQFANRKYLQTMIAQDADIEFASFDVFLGNDIVVVLFVNELDSFFELLVAFDKRRLRYAQR